MTENLKIFILVFAVLSSGLAFTETENTAVVAPKKVSFRFGTSLGPWCGNFSQSGNSYSTSFNTRVSLGLNLNVGIRVQWAFFEYHLTWLMSPYSGSYNPQDATLIAPLGINAGATFPEIPIEPYIGLEYATYRLSGGANPAYSGIVLKTGLNGYFSVLKKVAFGMRLEYRRMIPSSDDAGKLPSSISTSANMYFLGFIFRFQS